MSRVAKDSHISVYAKSIPWYLASSILTKLMGFILLPIYTSYFTPSEVGSIAVYESVGRMVVIFISLYLDSAFLRYYYSEKAREEKDITSFFSTHFWFLLFWGGAVSVVLSGILNNVMPGLPSATISLVPILIFGQFFSQLTLLVTSVWVAEIKAKRLAIYNLVFTLIAFSLTAYLITISERGWESRFLAVLVVSIFQFIFVIRIALLQEWINFSFNKALIIRSLKYSVPLIPNIAAGWISMFSDRIIMSVYGELDQVGVYSIAAQLALILYIVNDAVTRVQGPLAMSGMTHNKNNAKKKMSEFLPFFLSVMILVYFLMAGLLPMVITPLFGSSYVEAYFVFLLLAWVYILTSIYRVFTTIVSFHNKTWLISIGALMQAGTNFGLNILFIPKYGMYAAASSTVISIAVYTIWLAFWAQKLDRIRLDMVRFFALFFVCISGSLFFVLINKSNINLNLELGLTLFVMVSLLGAVYWLQSNRTKVYFRRKLRKLSGRWV